MEKNFNIPIISKANHYSNPVKYKNNEIHTNPDPYVIKYCGIYYCYSTDVNGVNVSVSQNLVDWEYKGYCISEENYHNYWAPCVFYDNGTFYMYYSNTKADENDCHKQFLKVAVASNPLGPFILKKQLFDVFSIDAHLIKSGRELFMFYSTNNVFGCENEIAGTCILVDKMIDFFTLEGNPRVVVYPSIKEELFEANRFNDGRDWYTIEGAFYWVNKDKAYVMYSANAYENENYFLGYSTCDKQEDFFEQQFKKFPNNYTFSPLVKKNEHVEGTGHNSIIKAPNLVDDWLVYHGRDVGKCNGGEDEQRVMRIDPLMYNGDILFTNAPSYEVRDAPLKADVEKKDIKNYTSKKEYLAYIAEVWLEIKKNHTGGRYGFILNQIDRLNYIELRVFVGLNKAEVIVACDGIENTIETIFLSKDYNHYVFHSIKVERKIYDYNIAFDDGTSIEFSYRLESGSFAVYSQYTDLNIKHLSLTEHIELYRSELKLFGRFFQPQKALKSSEEGIVIVRGQSLRFCAINNMFTRYIESFIFELLNSDSNIGLSFISDDDHVEILINNHVCNVIINGMLNSEFDINNDKFTVSVFCGESGCYFIIDGKTVDIRNFNGLKCDYFDLSFTTLMGYRKTSISQ